MRRPTVRCGAPSPPQLRRYFAAGDTFGSPGPISISNLAFLLQVQCEQAAAGPLFERALAIYERSLGPDHPDTARGLNNLAAQLYEQGELAAARPLSERVLAIYERSLGPDHPHTARVRTNLERLRRRRE